MLLHCGDQYCSDLLPFRLDLGEWYINTDWRWGKNGSPPVECSTRAIEPAS